VLADGLEPSRGYVADTPADSRRLLALGSRASRPWAEGDEIVKYSRLTQGGSAREAVLMMISDPFVAAFAAEIPVTLVGSEVVEERSATWRHVMNCEFSTSRFDLPAAVKNILPSIVKLSWQQTWTVHTDSEATALLHISTEGSPSSTTEGKARLNTEVDGLRYSFEGKTRVSVPLFGSSLASMVDEHLVSGVLDDQLAVLGRRLGQPS
jgi:hypothetical protein